MESNEGIEDKENKEGMKSKESQSKSQSQYRIGDGKLFFKYIVNNV